MANIHALIPPPAAQGDPDLRIVRAESETGELAVSSSELKIEIGHVLCIDVVGYSKLLIHAQSELLQALNEVVRATPQVLSSSAAGTLLRLPTGDGMVLVFQENPEAPIRCALEINEALKNHPTIRLRMGVHSGPVNEVVDVNERANIAGAGINIAQRVMDCGDAGHILLSKRVAEDLEHYARWQPLLHELGNYETKHGAVVSLVNFYGEDFGNRALPEQFKRNKARAQPRRLAGRIATRQSPSVVPLLLIGGSMLAAFWFISHPMSPAPGATSSPSATPGLTNPVIPEKSIAVLPFDNLSADPDTAFFADGIQDEILTDLAKVADLKVISRTSVMQYKTVRARNLREIGRQLGVAHVLEGSVQRAGQRLRINAQLIDARTDAHLWAQVYDRDVADVFAVQTEIAQAIADQLQAEISPRERAALAQTSTTDLVAERLFRQAWQQIELASNPDAKAPLFKAVELLDEAITRDPHFLRAYGLLVTAQMDLYWQGFDHTPARLELARQTVEKAAQIAPDSGEVHLMRADYVYKADRDYDRARAELQLARKTLPNNSLINIYQAAIDRRQGRWDESVQNWERGVSLDPRNFRYLMETAFTYQALRRFSAAEKIYQRALTILPQDHFAQTQRAQLAFSARADLAPWRTTLATILDKDPEAATEIANGQFFCALAERDPEAVKRAIESIRPEGLRDPYNNSLWAREWFVGLGARTFGDTAGAQRAFLAARTIEENTVREQPNYAPAWSRLGLIDAGLGRAEEAQREGRHACELLPVSKDSWDGPTYVTNLAMIYAWTGDKARALVELARSAQLPGGVTYGELKLSPQWDALRRDPQFEKIVDSLAPVQLKR